MTTGEARDLFEDPRSGLVHENVIVLAVRADERCQKTVVYVPVHSAEQDRPAVGDAPQGGDRRFRDRGDRVVVFKQNALVRAVRHDRTDSAEETEPAHLFNRRRDEKQDPV